MNALLRTLLFAVLLTGGWDVPASAGVIDFSDGYGNLLPAFSKDIEEGGVPTGASATFSNVRSQTKIHVDYPTDRFFVNALGLGIGSGGFGYTMDVVFNQTVNLTSWDIGYGSTTEFGGTFGVVTISGAGVNFTYTFPPYPDYYPDIAKFELPSPLTFLAGQTYTFSSPNRCCDIPRPYPEVSPTAGGGSFSAWYFADIPAVPEPATLGLLALALATLAFQHAGARSAHKKTAV